MPHTESRRVEPAMVAGPNWNTSARRLPDGFYPRRVARFPTCPRERRDNAPTQTAEKIPSNRIFTACDIRPSGKPSPGSQIVQELRSRRDARHQQPVPRSRAGDIEQVPLGVL